MLIENSNRKSPDSKILKKSVASKKKVIFRSSAPKFMINSNPTSKQILSESAKILKSSIRISNDRQSKTVRSILRASRLSRRPIRKITMKHASSLQRPAWKKSAESLRSLKFKSADFFKPKISKEYLQRFSQERKTDKMSSDEVKRILKSNKLTKKPTAKLSSFKSALPRSPKWEPPSKSLKSKLSRPAGPIVNGHKYRYSISQQLRSMRKSMG